MWWIQAFENINNQKKNKNFNNIVFLYIDFTAVTEIRTNSSHYFWEFYAHIVYRGFESGMAISCTPVLYTLPVSKDPVFSRSIPRIIKMAATTASIWKHWKQLMCATSKRTNLEWKIVVEMCFICRVYLSNRALFIFFRT